MTSLLSILLTVLPPYEAKMIVHVAERYALTREQTLLLAAIRKTENGGPGLEFGVGQDQPGHPATRYKHSPASSFLTQAKWAAGTIKKRYTGDLTVFAQRYCPKNAESWRNNVHFWWTHMSERSK
jgi:hypothetical protein